MGSGSGCIAKKIDAIADAVRNVVRTANHTSGDIGDVIVWAAPVGKPCPVDRLTRRSLF